MFGTEAQTELDDLKVVATKSGGRMKFIDWVRCWQNPVAYGLAQSYLHPGEMITGNVMNAVGGEETMTQKRIGLLKDLV